MSDNPINDLSNSISTTQVGGQDQQQQIPSSSNGDQVAKDDSNGNDGIDGIDGMSNSQVLDGNQAKGEIPNSNSTSSSHQDSVSTILQPSSSSASKQDHKATSGNPPSTTNSIPTSIPPTKKFTSLSVNKRFLEKTSPNVSPTLKSGSIASGSSTSLSNGIGSGNGGSSPGVGKYSFSLSLI